MTTDTNPYAAPRASTHERLPLIIIHVLARVAVVVASVSGFRIPSFRRDRFWAPRA
jgi:hypothetical protein